MKKWTIRTIVIILIMSPFVTWKIGHYYGSKKATEYNLALVENTIKAMNRKALAMNKE